MAESTRTVAAVATTQRDSDTRSRLVATGGILGALAASSCCILPLVLFSLGISGAWIANLTALAPYKPYFVAATLGLLGYGYYLVYLEPKQACPDQSCARPRPNRLVKFSLWIAIALVVAALAFDFVAPLLLA
jgi:mercuric ion transport protein